MGSVAGLRDGDAWPVLGGPGQAPEAQDGDRVSLSVFRVTLSVRSDRVTGRARLRPKQVERNLWRMMAEPTKVLRGLLDMLN
eukprot:254123-Hanusia_phi.AAC.1